jgi:hypothetical protein
MIGNTAVKVHARPEYPEWTVPCTAYDAATANSIKIGKVNKDSVWTLAAATLWNVSFPQLTVSVCKRNECPHSALLICRSSVASE